jgi:hypothetical protein
MWIYYYIYFVTEETCSTVAHIHTPQPRRLASADTRTEPDNDILEICMRDGNHGKRFHFNAEIERSREKARGRYLYLLYVNLTSNRDHRARLNWPENCFNWIGLLGHQCFKS